MTKTINRYFVQKNQVVSSSKQFKPQKHYQRSTLWKSTKRVSITTTGQRFSSTISQKSSYVWGSGPCVAKNLETFSEEQACIKSWSSHVPNRVRYIKKSITLTFCIPRWSWHWCSPLLQVCNLYKSWELPYSDQLKKAKANDNNIIFQSQLSTVNCQLSNYDCNVGRETYMVWHQCSDSWRHWQSREPQCKSSSSPRPWSSSPSKHPNTSFSNPIRVRVEFNKEREEICKRVNSWFIWWGVWSLSLKNLRAWEQWVYWSGVRVSLGGGESAEK